MNKPFVVGISGPTKAGKTTLAHGIRESIVPYMALAQKQEGGKDRVNRFCDAEGMICVSIIGQDSYFLTGMGQDTK
jgi:hypothetical protein